jgi:abortive infection bacteriophage resistance protein
MTFHKPALSVADQIKLLAQRGMKISDPHQAQHYLTHINYYRLRAYWLPYEIIDPNGDHQFRTGTRFADVIAIYQFDRALRLLLLDAIERIEISLRSRWANYLSINEKPRESPAFRQGEESGQPNGLRFWYHD